VEREEGLGMGGGFRDDGRGYRGKKEEEEERWGKWKREIGDGSGKRVEGKRGEE
jgi:hypothetical protein